MTTNENRMFCQIERPCQGKGVGGGGERRGRQRETEGERGRQRETEGERGRQRETEGDRGGDRGRQRERGGGRTKSSDRQGGRRERERDREGGEGELRDKQRDRDIDIEKDRQRERKRQTASLFGCMLHCRQSFWNFQQEIWDLCIFSGKASRERVTLFSLFVSLLNV